jgi:aminopeptidase N
MALTPLWLLAAALAWPQEISSTAPASRPAAPFLEAGKSAWVDRTYDLQHLHFDLSFDFAKRGVHGSATSTIEPLGAELREVEFDAEGLRVSAARVNGAPARTRTENKKLIVELAHPAKPGEQLEVRVDYECTPTTGLHWSGPEPGYESKTQQCYSQGQSENNHYWLPIHDYPNDRATWSCVLRVPSDMTAVSNGKLLDVRDEPGGATRAWKYAMDKPNCTYLISVAVGPWERYADEWRQIPVEYFVAKGTGEARARRSFGKTPEMLEFFSEWTGVPYPWDKYSQTAVAEFVVGGMENVSATTQTDQTLHDEKTHLERNSEGLVAHELAHQWWGDYLTCNGWRHLWLNEGFATYFTALWTEHSKGLDAYRLYMDSQRRSFLAADSQSEPRALVTTPENRRGDAASAHVYTKGSSVLHMLRFVVGDDNFRRALSLYAKRHALGLVETRDLERAFADATGRGLEWFWQEWVYYQGAPSFDVAHAFDAGSGNCVVTVKQTHKISALTPVFKMPVDLLFGFADQRFEIKKVWIDAAENRFSFTFPARPLFVRFDEGSWIACRLTHARTAEELCAQAKFDPDVVGRKEACERLGELISQKDDETVIEALAGVARGKDRKEVREAAVRAMKASKSPAARAAKLALLKDEEANVRLVSADGLESASKDSSVSAALQELLRSDPAYGPRAAAMRSLAAAGAESWDSAMEAANQASEREIVRNAGLDALAKLDPARAFPILLTSARGGAPYDSRERALELLVSMATKNDPKAPLPEGGAAAVAESVRAAAESNNWRLRYDAIRLMGQLDDPGLGEALARIAKESRDPQDVRAAEGAIAARKTRAEKAAK